jgi:dolichol-phosphate mannosyltransferase
VDPPLVSVVIPTLNEAENLPELAERLSAALRWRGYEIVIVDDGSRDDTRAVCQRLAGKYPLRLLLRPDGGDGLAGAVIEGLKRARGEYLLVMDADLQHPPEQVPALLALLENDEADFVMGSRHVDGASVDEHWGIARRAISWLATLLARPFAGRVRDPMSGFFALRKSTFDNAARLSPLGYKIALELICKCGVQRVREVPIHFATRHRGRSKLSLQEQFRYLRHLQRLYEFKHPRIIRPLCFLLTAALGTAGALGVKSAVESIGVGDLPAMMLACLALITLASLIRDQRELEPSDVIEDFAPDSKRHRHAA